jgi:outer membrane protein assembly factor BamE (lipoprotein component of BamABCDE complex)
MAWLQLVLVLGILTSGCGQVAYQRFDKQMWTNYIHVNELQKGMSKEEVAGIMGSPGIRESGDYRGGHYTIYFYLTHSMDFEDSNTVRNGYTPLVFKNDRLVGIGKRAYLGAVDRMESENQRMPRQSLPWSRTH